jgi:hypothetical protein
MRKEGGGGGGGGRRKTKPLDTKRLDMVRPSQGLDLDGDFSPFTQHQSEIEI